MVRPSFSSELPLELAFPSTTTSSGTFSIRIDDAVSSFPPLPVAVPDFIRRLKFVNIFGLKLQFGEKFNTKTGKNLKDESEELFVF